MTSVNLTPPSDSGGSHETVRISLEELAAQPCWIDLMDAVLDIGDQLEGSCSLLQIAIGMAITTDRERISLIAAALFKHKFGDAWQEKLMEAVSHGKR